MHYRQQSCPLNELLSIINHDCDINRWDYYIYNNVHLSPVEVMPDDMIDGDEGLIHFCHKGMNPAQDRMLHPLNVKDIGELFRIKN